MSDARFSSALRTLARRITRGDALWIPLRSGALHVTVRHWAIVLAWIVLTAFAYQTGRDLFFRLSYLVLGIQIFSFFWAAYSVTTFRLERRLITPRSQVGRVAEERFLVHNTGRFTKIWIEVRDESELKSHNVSRVLNALRAGVRWSWGVRTICRRRGRFRLGPITTAAGDPFGLFIFERRLPNTTVAITIHPATVDLLTFATPLGQLPGGEAVRRKTHHTTTNVAGTREYAPGDSFNRIHWRSTARMERLIVKEFELDPAADVWIFLDMERGVQAGLWWEDAWDTRDLSQLWFGEHRAIRLPPTTEEYIVAIAASIAKYFLRRQRAVGFVSYGHEHEIIQPDRGERQLNRLLEVLAVLRAEGNIEFGHVLTVESARLGRNNTLVAISPSADPNWVKSLREVKRRGLRSIAVTTDINTFGGHGDAEGQAAELLASGIPTYIVREGDDLQVVLSR
jgi:uncharacterized protein (DUF58 family)